MKVKALLVEPGKRPELVKMDLLNRYKLEEMWHCKGIGYLSGFPDPKVFMVLGAIYNKPQKANFALPSRLIYGTFLVGYADYPLFGAPKPPHGAIDIPNNIIAIMHELLDNRPIFPATMMGDNFH